MRFYRTRRLRIISGGSLLLLLAGLPVLLGFTRPAGGAPAEAPGVVTAYAAGLSSLGVAGIAALVLALVFGLWLLAGKRQEVARRHYVAHNTRGRENLLEAVRTLAVVFGAAGLIVGSLAGFYAAMMLARPDLADSLRLPFLTAELALVGLLGGGALYALGRLGRF
jgi:hypothetical protein